MSQNNFKVLHDDTGDVFNPANPHPMIRLGCLNCGYTFWTIARGQTVSCPKCIGIEKLKKELYTIFFADNTVIC